MSQRKYRNRENASFCKEIYLLFFRIICTPLWMNYLVIFNIYIFSKSTRFLLGTGLRVNKVDKVDRACLPSGRLIRALKHISFFPYQPYQPYQLYQPPHNPTSCIKINTCLFQAKTFGDGNQVSPTSIVRSVIENIQWKTLKIHLSEKNYYQQTQKRTWRDLYTTILNTCCHWQWVFFYHHVILAGEIKHDLKNKIKSEQST